MPDVGRGARWLGALLAAVALAGAAAGEACPYPLGDHLLTGDVLVLGGSALDPAEQLVDTVWIGTQLSPSQFAYEGGRVQMVYETETDVVVPGTAVETESHVIAYKAFSPRTGWNVRPEFVSSASVGAPATVGDHTTPALVASGDRAWVAWQVAGPSGGDPAWPDSGSYLLVRERTPDGWGPTGLLAPADAVSRSSLPKGAEVGGTPLFLYQTNAAEPDAHAFHIVAQPLGAAGPGAPVNVSTPADGWSDEGVAVASGGDTAVAVWSERNVSDIFARGASRVVASVRGPSGAWSAPVTVSLPGQDGIDKPAVAVLEGRALIAWTAFDAAVSGGADTSLFARTLDVATGGMSPAAALTGPMERGDETFPAVAAYNGSFYLAWGSNSAPGGGGSTWQFARTYACRVGADLSCTGAMVDRPGDALLPDLWPGLLAADGALIVTYGLAFGDFVGTAGNQHTVARVLERQPWAGDALSASYGMDAAAPGKDGVARLAVRFAGEGGVPAPSDHYALRMSDGSVMRLPAGFAEGEFKVPYRAGRLAAPEVALWCGQPLPTSTFALGPAPGDGLLPGFGGGAAALAAAAAALIAARRAGGRPITPPPTETETP
jgi:hypothetical protein